MTLIWIIIVWFVFAISFGIAFAPTISRRLKNQSRPYRSVRHDIYRGDF